jgi:hypothetical protein
MAYKMKGFSGFKSSPAKVSDADVVKAQRRLDHVELDFREPGWTKAARGVVEGGKKILGSMGGGDKKGKKAASEVASLGDDGLEGDPSASHGDLVGARLSEQSPRGGTGQ